MRVLVIGIAIALAACVASRQPTKTAGNGPGSGLVCKEETPTGTSMSRTVCRTPEQIEDERRAADDMLRMPPSRPGGQ